MAGIITNVKAVSAYVHPGSWDTKYYIDGSYPDTGGKEFFVAYYDRRNGTWFLPSGKNVKYGLLEAGRVAGNIIKREGIETDSFPPFDLAILHLGIGMGYRERQGENK